MELITPHADLSIVVIPLFYWGIRTRRFIREHSPFYGPSNILIVGATLGIATFFGTTVLWWVSGLRAGMAWLGALLGLLAIAFVSIRPDPIDEHLKCGQTVIVAAACYIVLIIIAFLAVAVTGFDLNSLPHL